MYLFLRDYYEIVYNNYNTNECVICLNKYGTTLPLSSINYKNNYKVCNCKCFVHYKCLEKWFEVSLTCPICRSTYYEYVYNFFNFYKILFFIINILYIFLVIYYIYYIYKKFLH